MPKPGGPEDLAKAMRSVRIEPLLDKGIADISKKVAMRARLLLRAVDGTFSRTKAEISVAKQGGVEMNGLLAMVAEYGMSGRSWSNWHGARVQQSPIPPPRFPGGGRPTPEDGHVIGQAWKMSRKELTAEVADTIWEGYSIQFDRKGIYKVGL